MVIVMVGVKVCPFLDFMSMLCEAFLCILSLSLFIRPSYNTFGMVAAAAAAA